MSSDDRIVGFIGRRRFLKLVGMGAASALGARLPVFAGPFSMQDPTIPVDKKLDPRWIASLTARGEPEVYRGEELDKIGMPIGGICAGHVYLGGDGKLWLWNIFNQFGPPLYSGPHYAEPLKPSSPFEQGFAIKIGDQTRRLDKTGFRDIRFRGTYPIGTVEYSDDDVPVRVSLEAFSPFIPLNEEDSGFPAIVMSYRIENRTEKPVEVELFGWLENAISLHSGTAETLTRVNSTVGEEGFSALLCSARPTRKPGSRPPHVLADFEAGSYEGWTAEGNAFGNAPAHGAQGADQRISGFSGHGLVNTYQGSDQPKGKLTSPEFTIRRPYLNFLIGGGNHPGQTCINLLVGGKVVRTETGKDSDVLRWSSWDVRDLSGKTARIEIVDAHSGGWGHIDIDRIEQDDVPKRGIGDPTGEADFGTMALGVLHDRHASDQGRIVNYGDGFVVASNEPGRPASKAVGKTKTRSAEAVVGEPLSGTVAKRLKIGSGEAKTATFLIAWHFPNLRIDGLPTGGRYYATKFKDASDVARQLAKRYDTLSAQTRLWRDTWYDSTLPYWFLDRTFANTSTLATATCYRLKSGRFYAWEGIDCCAGTCTHVWHYAHAVGRLFPALERRTREEVDYGIAFDPKTGAIDHRGEFRVGPATDGQAGCILRAYREHLMTTDAAFLKRNWPKIKQSIQYLIDQDGNADGLIEGAQHNTLDSAWFGPISWLSSLYVAALCAGEAMAEEVEDLFFARQCGLIAGKGSDNIADRLWNGEYFIQIPDPKHPEAMKSGNGCEIDQVFGQSWAFQVGLPRVLDEDKTKLALRALYKYNFAPDVGPFRKANPNGRWYAMAGDGGLIMCTFPKGGGENAGGKVNPGFAGYFNECMSGFEYQAAGHMIWEGLVTEGLAVTRAIHDRYQPRLRNPYNEIECADHYARAMASYGVFLAACGYGYHGPKRTLGFSPKIHPENFKAAFTTAEGWGTYSQQYTPTGMLAEIELKYGRLSLTNLTIEAPEGRTVTKVEALLDGKPASPVSLHGDREVLLSLSGVDMKPGDHLRIELVAPAKVD
jgi:uncharacterized protein (DUF608 family)